MSIRNTSKSYGTIAKFFHWFTAILFLTSYISVYYRQWFTQEKTPENWTALQLHLSIGVSIGVIVLLRIIWRALEQQPLPEPGSKLEHSAAKTGHILLYVMMILMPITGYLGTGANTEFFFLFDIPKFTDTALYQHLFLDGLGISFEQMEPLMDYVHKDIGGQWIVWLLILGHAGAALFHHYVKKDRTLVKMTKE